MSLDDLNAYAPMSTPADPLAKVSVLSDDVPWKVLEPISLTDAGMVTEVTFLHPLKAPSRAATFLPSTVDGTLTAPFVDFA